MITFEEWRQKIINNPTIKDEIDQKVKLFFFPPNKTHEEYNDCFTKSYLGKKEKPRFSPLYRGRRAIFYCYGINPENLDLFYQKISFGPEYFLGIFLIYESCEMIAKIIGQSPEKTLRKIGIQSQEHCHALKRLRDSITHKQFGLRIEWSSSDKTPTFFRLVERGNFIIHDYIVKRSYRTRAFTINVNRLHRGFKTAVKNLEEDLLNQHNERLRWRFSESVRTKHWVYYL